MHWCGQPGKWLCICVRTRCASGTRMRALLQRVSDAKVVVAGETVGAIRAGLLVFLGVERGDDQAVADRLLERMLGYRVFPDADGRMNRSLRDTGGGLLVVSQFTLVADTRKGTRPGFSNAGKPAESEALYDYLTGRARNLHPIVASGIFGADMQVTLTNDGPVTFLLEV